MKYILFAKDERVTIYRNFWLFKLRHAEFPIGELKQAIQYLNHLNDKK